jgi:glycerophosphoryl diester phosphodiesterase
MESSGYGGGNEPGYSEEATLEDVNTAEIMKPDSEDAALEALEAVKQENADLEEGARKEMNAAEATKPFPKITAHTGCMNTAENSMTSIQTGIRFGADMIEDDIRITRDGVLVLSHDDQVLLANGRMGSIAGMTLAELHEMQESPLAELEPVLGIVLEAGLTMNLDIKTDACLPVLSDRLESMGILDRVFLTGCRFDWTLQAQKINPRMRKLLNADPRLFTEQEYSLAVETTCRHALDSGCYGINLPYRLVRSELLAQAAARGLDVYVWTVDEAEEMKRLADLGVQSITTKRPDLLLQLKRDWTSRGRENR